MEVSSHHLHHSAIQVEPTQTTAAKATQLLAPTTTAGALPVNIEGVGVLADAVILEFGTFSLLIPPTGVQRTSPRTSTTTSRLQVRIVLLVYIERDVNYH